MCVCQYVCVRSQLCVNPKLASGLNTLSSKAMPLASTKSSPICSLLINLLKGFLVAGIVSGLPKMPPGLFSVGVDGTNSLILLLAQQVN